jgi:hypothetical protein
MHLLHGPTVWFGTGLYELILRALYLYVLRPLGWFHQWVFGRLVR